MDDLLTFLLIPVLVGGVGWLMGIAGYVKARRALARADALERAVKNLIAAMSELAQKSTGTPIAAAPVGLAPVAATAVTAPKSVELSGPSVVVGEPVQPATNELVATPPKRDIEALLTLRWGVWLGSAALLLAGVFLIRYAVDSGLLGPAVRCTLAALLGATLVAGGEASLRRSAPRHGMADQVPAALTAGGLAMLFGAAYGAGPLYLLVPPMAAFGLMAAVGVGGLALSLRQGQLVAAIGLAGAFVTPILIAGDASLPGLFLYLLIVTAAALAVVRLTAWAWLGWAATIAGAAYVIAVLPGLAADVAWAPAGFVAVAAGLNLALLPKAALDSHVGRLLAWVPFAVLGVCGLLLCAAVDAWTVYAALLLLAPVAIAKGWAEPRLDRLPWLAALFCLLMLRIMVLPPWHATGEAVVIEGGTAALLPGGWAPPEVQPLLWTALLVAAWFGLTGLWLERRTPRPARWAALTAAVPVLCLALAFAQVRSFQSDSLWALVAVALSGGLVGTAALARREGNGARAGVHAAGAVAALALGCAMLLAEQWLTLALALFLPALAWVEAQADLPALRRVALVVAVVVLARLLLNWYVLDYAFGSTPFANGLLAAYGAPAVAFGIAAVAFHRRAADLTVASLQAGTVALTAVFVAAEIHHWATGGALAQRDLSFLEAGLHIDALGILALAVLRIGRFENSVVLRRGWQVLGALALVGGVIMLFDNPAVSGADVGRWPVFDDLLAVYAVPAALAAVAVWQPEARSRLLGGSAVVAAFAWLSLEVRHVFHPAAMGWDDAPVLDAELWAWSGAWLIYGGLLLAAGIAWVSKPLRLAALAIIGIATAKVFLIDMAGLVGLWRVVSFLGLGLALIALGAVYRKFVAATTLE